MARSLQFALESVIHSVIEHGTLTEPTDPERVRHLRFSGLPFCPVRWFAKANTNLAKKASKPFGYGFYTRIGTAVHTVFQSALTSIPSLPGKLELIADWRCSGCGHVHRFCTAPEVCSKCGQPSPEFEEHEVVLESGKTFVKALGHVDCILRLRTKSGQYVYYILDFKTTSKFSISKAEFKVSSSYATQLSSYAAAVSHVQGVEVVGTALVYVARDSYHTFKVVTFDETQDSRKSRLNRLQRFMVQLGHMQSARYLSDMEVCVQQRPCSKEVHPDFADCPFISKCAGSDSGCRTLLKESMQTLKSKGRLPILHYLNSLPLPEK